VVFNNLWQEIKEVLSRKTGLKYRLKGWKPISGFTRLTNMILRYKGNQVTLTSAPSTDRFAVLFGDKPIGQIKIGYERHTWFVVDSNYVEYDLVNEIGQRIVEQYY
jgi:NOL1/NOP2/fmu family ribosome biogenesis protein